MKKDGSEEKEAIVLAAIKVFENYGLSKVSMLDISKACGLGRSSLYYYYKNKMEVFDAVCQKLFREIYEKSRAEVSPQQSLEVNMEKYQLKKLKEIKKVIKKHDLAFVDLKTDPSMLFTKIRVLMNEEITLLNEVLNWAMEKNEIRQISAEEQRFMAETMVTSLRSFEQEVILFDRFPDMEVKLSWLASIFSKGLK